MGRVGKGPGDEAELGPVDQMAAPGKANGKHWGENPCKVRMSMQEWGEYVQVLSFICYSK